MSSILHVRAPHCSENTALRAAPPPSTTLRVVPSPRLPRGRIGTATFSSPMECEAKWGGDRPKGGGGATAQIPSSFLTSFRNRQSVPFAMIWSGDDLIMPSSRSRSAQKRTESSTSYSRQLR